MAQKKLISLYSSFNGGISDFSRFASLPNSYAFGRSIDVRSDPQNLTVLPRTIKESGNVITGLPKWLETYTPTLISYIYDGNGTLYSRSNNASYINLRTVANSHGNGLVYSAEDDFLYYSGDKVIGRYGPLSSSTPTFVDDFFGSQGGTPLNTNSVDFEASSSQYASRADTASLSITGNIAMDIQIKPESLPTTGNQMVLMSKWDESGATRSYKFDINNTSGYFGDGSDGALTISVNTTEAPIDSACSGISGTSTLTATNASFAAGQIVLIHQSRGSGAGTWVRNTIQSYTTGTITLVNPLNATYASSGNDRAQVRVMKQYTNVTINSGITYTVKTWNASSNFTGGILSFIASGTITINGSINGNGLDGTTFIGGVGLGYTAAGTPPAEPGTAGEGTVGAPISGSAPNGNAGGGSYGYSGAGGGGNATAGTTGVTVSDTDTSFNTPGVGGLMSGTTDLTTMVFGGAGGSSWQASGAAGGGGGAIVFITGATITMGVAGSIVVNGGSGGSASVRGGGGGGAGGCILLKAQIATLGAGLITALGGAGGIGGAGHTPRGNGGAGSVGRIHLDYYTSYTGTTSPTLDATQDNTLVTNTSYQLRLSLSSTGSNSEILAQEVNIITDTWQQVGVSWTASTSTAIFYLNGTEIGTRVGAFTSINDNTSRFALATSYNGAGAAANFYDGLMDEARLFNVARSGNDMRYGLQMQIPTNTAGLQAYYKLNGNFNDATANTNNLTPTNTPVFGTDVPYPSPTTRLDIDQTGGSTGNTYAVPTTISEAAADKLTFTPSKDPQKSIQFNVANIGTGTWTITIHDQYNNVIATSTVTNANMHTGNYEFIYSQVWSPLTNFTSEYHAHITCTAGSPTVVSTASNDLETAQFVTYFQFLVTDTEWHPMSRLLQFWIVGNGRYIGKYEATLYDPNFIVLGGNWRVRCLADWREFKAIGVMQGSNIYDLDRGRVYFWDGIAPTFNFYIDVPEGGINAMLGSRGRLYIWAGYKNQLLVYEGGDSAQKLKDMPNMENTKYSEIYPQGVTMWQSLLRYGVAGGGDSLTVQKGIYTWGSTNFRYPEILTYDYPISTGTLTGTSTKVSLVSVVNKKLLIGWQDNVSYGMDYVDTSNMPYPTAQVDFMIEDNGNVLKIKEGVEVVATCAPLASDQSIALSYDQEGSGVFVPNQDPTTEGQEFTRMIVSNGRYYEAQTRLDINSGTTSPTVKGIELITDSLIDERIAG